MKSCASPSTVRPQGRFAVLPFARNQFAICVAVIIEPPLIEAPLGPLDALSHAARPMSAAARRSVQDARAKSHLKSSSTGNALELRAPYGSARRLPRMPITSPRGA